MWNFQELSPKQNFGDLDQEIIDFWKQNNTFQKSVEQRPKENTFRFYDWPPFITGVPHHWHLLASTVKDAIPRYWTMKWKRCERVWWWDCHWIPVEEKVMKKLWLTKNSEIESTWVENFIKECYNYTNQVSSEWDWYIDHIWRWVDFQNAYKTMDQDYMESVMWVFKELYDKWMIYKGKRISLYSVKLGTPISNFEVAMDDSYENVNDPSITVKFDLSPNWSNREGISALVWTTTPWTLPANMALAINKECDYVIVETEEWKFLVAENRLEDIMKWKGNYKILDSFKGNKLEWLIYEPVFPFYKDKVGENNFKIYHADFITDTNWTGIWHQAPEFGEEDFGLWKQYWLHQTEAIDDECNYSEEIPDYKWRFIKDCQEDIMERLKQEGKLFRKESITHRVAICPRTNEPLVYRAQDSWFLDVQSIKDKLLDKNENISWYPEHLKYWRFAKNIEAAPDWCLSRNRYWATPMPMWTCENCWNIKVVGSREEIKQLSWQEITDLHRPYIDEIIFQCPECEWLMKRVPEVVDVWLESGSMPVAQLHYPFENEEKFRQWFPADFIAEYVGQVRAWFYVMHVVSTAMFGSQAYNNVLTTGVIAGSDGRKMSKSFNNFTDPKVLMKQYWWDSLRFYMMASPLVRWGDMNFKNEWVEDTVKKVLLPVWNTLYFFTTYANIDNFKPSDNNPNPENPLDRWIVSELNKLIRDVDQYMQDYDLQGATKVVSVFIENLSNWYIRRSRRRFWKSENDEDKMSAYQVLYHVLVEFSKVLAPLCPFISEKVFKILTGKESVHLEYFPEYDESKINNNLSEDMQKVQKIISLGLSLRAKNNIRVRQPLSTLSIWEKLDDYYIQIIKEELNVKEVEILDDMSKIATKICKPNAKLLWPKYGKSVQDIIKNAKEGNFKQIDGWKVNVIDFVLEPDEYEIVYEKKEWWPDVEWDVWIVVGLDLNITEELKNEWYARDIIRYIQEARKEADYNVDDRIQVEINFDNDNFGIVEKFGDYIQQETLSYIVESLENPDIIKSFEVDELKWEAKLKK